MDWTWKSEPTVGGDRYNLVATQGSIAATVYSNGIWHTWDPQGNGGQNDKGRNVEDAKYISEHVAKVWWYENGWADARRL